MNKKLSLFLLGLTLGLTACTTTPDDCDPSIELNVFNKMACSFSGSYDKRVETKKQELTYEREISRELNDIQKMIANEQATVNKSAAQKKQQLSKLNKSVNSLTSQLKKKAQGRETILAQLDDVEKQMKTINNSGGSEAAKQQELKKLQNKLDTLKKALDL